MNTHDATREALASIDATLADADNPGEVMAMLRDDLDRRLAVMRAGPSIATVLSTVSRATGVPVSDIVGYRRFGPIRDARNLAYLACREFTEHSYAAIGRHIGGRDNSTIVTGTRRARHLIATEPGVGEIWREIVIELTQEAPHGARGRGTDGANGVLRPSGP